MAGMKRGPPPSAVAEDRPVKQPRMDEQAPQAKVTLTADGREFAVDPNKMAAVSECFRAMFTNGMRETKHNVIKLKGVSATGLEKTLEIVDKGGTSLRGTSMTTLIAAATYLLVTPAIEFCERAIAGQLRTSNFFHFSDMARLYGLHTTKTLIDRFIAKNLMKIARKGALRYVSLDQMKTCLKSSDLLLPELDVFHITCEWLRQNPDMVEHTLDLMLLIKFRLINLSDLVRHVQKVSIMTSHTELLQLVLAAMNYHVVPYSQPLADKMLINPRHAVAKAVCVASFEVNGNERTVLTVFNPYTACSKQRQHRRRVVTLPQGLDGMQVVTLNNFLYVLGGMNMVSFSNNVCRYDPRSNQWYQATPMLRGRYRFYAGALHNKIYAVGGDCVEGATITSAECYDLTTNKWEEVAPLPVRRHIHSGAVLGHYIYISGGCTVAQSTSSVYRYDPVLDTWEPVASMLGPRGGHVMVAARGRLFVFGGHVLTTENMVLNETRCESYDPVTDQWTLLAPLGAPHDGSSWLQDDHHVWVIGGWDAQNSIDQKLVSRYDLDMDTWEVLTKWPRTLRMFGSRFCILEFPKVRNEPSFSTVSIQTKLCTTAAEPVRNTTALSHNCLSHWLNIT